AGLNGGQAVGDREAEIVVAVGAEDQPVRVGDAGADGLEEAPHLVGRRVADRVGQVDRAAALAGDGVDDAAQEVEVAPRRILRRKLHVVGVAPRQADGGGGG